MKIQLDTTNKVITVEENVNLGEFVRMIQKLLHKDCPFGEWKEYSLNSNTVIYNWGNPLIIDRSPVIYPWWQQPYTYTTGDATNAGDFNPSTSVMNIELAYN